MESHSSQRSNILLATFTTFCIVSVAICVIAVALPQRSNFAVGGMTENILTEPTAKKEPNGAIQHAEDEDLKFSIKSSGVKLPQKNMVILATF